jgi:hypothetical protein
VYKRQRGLGDVYKRQVRHKLVKDIIEAYEKNKDKKI